MRNPLLFLISSTNAMLFAWMGFTVFGVLALFGLWGNENSYDYIFCTIAAGVIGMLREVHLQKTRQVDPRS